MDSILSLNNQSAFTKHVRLLPLSLPLQPTTVEMQPKYSREKLRRHLSQAFSWRTKDRYAISAAFAVTGGGGKAVFNNGLPSFEAPVSMIPLLTKANGINTTTYSVDQFMEGRQYIFGVQLNGTYKINDALSAAVGLRLNIVNNGYKDI